MEMQVRANVLRYHDSECPIVGTPSSPTAPKIMVVETRKPLSEQLASAAESSSLDET
jgi:hypothetical protein